MLIVSTDAKKTVQVEESLHARFSEEPQISMDTLREEMEYTKGTFSIFFGITMGLSLFIIGFSLINLINTLITSILSRKQEFAAIQSLGMTHGQLKKMIIAEGLILAVGNILITLVLGTVIGIAVINALQSVGADYMHYHFPLVYFLGYALVIMGIPILISAVSIKILKKQSLVDRLRTVD
jgi:putative ABC transport system permease protein